MYVSKAIYKGFISKLPTSDFSRCEYLKKLPKYLKKFIYGDKFLSENWIAPFYFLLPEATLLKILNDNRVISHLKSILKKVLNSVYFLVIYGLPPSIG